MLLGKYDIDEMQRQQEEDRPLIVTDERARKALMSKLNRSGGMSSGRNTKRIVQRGIMARGNSFGGMRFGQRVVVKIRYVKHKAKAASKTAGLGAGTGVGKVGKGGAGGGASALRSHVNYISRGEAGKDGEQAVLFNAREEGVDKNDFVALCADDRHHWRFIISPENGHQIEDFQGYIRGIMGRVEGDLGTKLEWVSAVHYDTDDVHAHVIVRGRNDREQDLVIGQDYIKEGIRRRAQELATEILGERSLEEIQKSLEAEVDALRVTSLDRFIEKQATKERIVDARKQQNFGKDPSYEKLVKARLRYLSSAGFAKEAPPGVFTLNEGYKDELARMAEKNDVIKRLYKKGVQQGLDGLAVYSLKAEEARTVEGRVLDKGIHDELTERKYVVVKDLAGKLHYAPLAEGRQYDELEAGSLVKLAPGGQSTGKADRNISDLAEKNGGIYDAALHKDHIDRHMKFIPEQDRPKYLEWHQVRLATLVKNGVVKDLGEGRYEVAADVIERGEAITREINARENKRFYPKLEVLSAKPIEKLAEVEKKTWLDKELYQQGRGTPSLSAYDAAAEQALEARKAWLVRQDLAFIQSNGEFALRDKALQQLDRMEVKAAGKKLAEKLGFEFRDATVQPDTTLRYEGYVTIETGSWAVVSKAKALYLVSVAAEPGLARGVDVVFRQPSTGKQLEITQAAHSRGKEQEKSQDREVER